MESINFNDFSRKERHEIIKAFLIKMRTADSMDSAQSFFEYYLKEFYKLPPKLLEDIVYCQRAMKTYLTVHKAISDTFENLAEADLMTKKGYLLDIEDVLYEINAECQYLILRIQDDVDRFCLPFTEQELKPNKTLISDIISETLVPLICAKEWKGNPHFAIERPTEKELLSKYLTTGPETNDSPNNKLDDNKSKRKFSLNGETTAPKESSKENQSTKADKLSEAASKDDVVNASRQNLQAALERARLNQNIKAKSDAKTDAKTDAKNDAKADTRKEEFLGSFGLCTQQEYKDRASKQPVPHKRKPKLIKK